MTGFELITVYSMHDQKFKLSSVLKISLQTVFYSLFILILCAGTGWKQHIDIKSIIKQLFTPIYNVYWFVTAYIGMYLFIPHLKKICEKLRRD